MSKMLTFVFAVLLFFSFTQTVYGDSERAYQDYLYQFDQYRFKFNEFEVAKNEYEKFGTLTSQTAAIEKSKNMLAQRGQLLRAYLLLLDERLTESTSMNQSTKELYKILLNNEVSFLDNHSLLVESVNSIDVATDVSKDLEDHYTVLQTTIRQTILGLTIADLESFGDRYETALLNFRTIINANTRAFSLEKQATIDRWLLQITNKRTLFLRKIDEIKQENENLTGSSIDVLDDKFTSYRQELAEAKQELVEGAAFMNELVNTLQYRN